MISNALKYANRTTWMTKRRYKFQKRYPRINKLSDAGAKIFGLQKQVNFMKGIINSELYTNDTSASVAVTNTGSMIPLCEIAQGDDTGNRTGNSILAKQLYVRFLCTLTSPAVTTFLRIIIFCDTSNDGNIPAVSDVLQSVQPNSPLNVDSFGRYSVLYDRCIGLNEGDKRNLALKVFKRPNVHIKFNGNTATDYYKNSLFMLLLSDQPTNHPSVAYFARLRYHDN